MKTIETRDKDQFQTLLEEPKTREFLRRLFIMANKIAEPALKMKDISHWQGIKSKLEIDTPELDNSLAYIYGGYFYNFSTPELSNDEVANALHLTKQLQAKITVIPTVRDDINESVLTSYGFIKLPWFIESIFEIETNFKNDIRHRVGAKKLSELKRESAKAKTYFEWDWLTGDDLSLNTALVDITAFLHGLNARKYSHTVNLYSTKIINNILNSELKSNLRVGLRKSKATGQFVQTVIMLIDEGRSHLHLLVHGKVDSLDEKVNLYNSLFFDILEYADNKRLKTIY